MNKLISSDSAEASSEAGFSLIEVLVSISIFAIASLGSYLSITTGLNVAKHTEVHYAASSLASSKLEEIASRDINSVDSSLNEVTHNVTWAGLDLTFTRTTVVTVNADDSRTVSVTVSCDHPKFALSRTFSTLLTRWE